MALYARRIAAVQRRRLCAPARRGAAAAAAAGLCDRSCRGRLGRLVRGLRRQEAGQIRRRTARRRPVSPTSRLSWTSRRICHVRRLAPSSRGVPVPTGATTLNALTIDVEDYFHVSGFERCVSRSQWDDFPSRVADNTYRLLDILAAAGVQGTFFVLGWVAERQPGLVKDIRAAGHEIGCHGYWHRLIYSQTPDEFRADLRRGRDVLQDILGEAVTAYRAPSFSITRQSLVGAGRAGRGRLPSRLQHLPDAPRPLRHPRRAAGTAPHRAARPARCGSFRRRCTASAAIRCRSAAAAGSASTPTP